MKNYNGEAKKLIGKTISYTQKKDPSFHFSASAQGYLICHEVLVGHIADLLEKVETLQPQQSSTYLSLMSSRTQMGPIINVLSELWGNDDAYFSQKNALCITIIENLSYHLYIIAQVQKEKIGDYMQRSFTKQWKEGILNFIRYPKAVDKINKAGQAYFLSEQYVFVPFFEASLYSQQLLQIIEEDISIVEKIFSTQTINQFLQNEENSLQNKESIERFISQAIETYGYRTERLVGQFFNRVERSTESLNHTVLSP